MAEKRWITPESWQWSEANEFSVIIAGGTPRNSTSEDNYSKGGIPWLTPADLSNYHENTISRGERSLSAEGYENSSAKLVPQGSVLFTSRAPIGYCVIAGNEISTNQGFKNFVPAGGIDPYFLRYYLINSKAYAESKASGTTFLELSGKKAAELSFPIAPLNEQKRITNKIDSLFARSNKAEKALRNTLNLVKLYKASVFKKYLLSGLRNLDGRENSAAISIGLPSVKLKKGWVWTKLSDIAQLESGHTPRKSDPFFWNNGDIPWISLKDIRAADQKIIFDTSKSPNQKGIDNSSARLLPKGTVVFSRDISVGYVTIMGREMATSQHFANWICGQKINNFYLQYALASSRNYLLNSGQGTTVKTIYMPALKEFYIALPSLEKQIEIVHVIQDNFHRIDQIQSISNKCEEQLSKLNRSILTKAFCGELVSQDPSDEPANQLLKRIEIEREQLEKELKFRKKVARKKTTGKNITMIIPVIDALKQSEKPLSSQQLLSAAGYPNNADTDQIEQFFLDIRKAIDDMQVEIWREDDQDYFRLAG